MGKEKYFLQQYRNGQPVTETNTQAESKAIKEIKEKGLIDTAGLSIEERIDGEILAAEDEAEKIREILPSSMKLKKIE